MARGKPLRASGLTDDPRRPDQVLQLPQEKVNLEELPPDFMVIISIVCGIAGLLLKSKLSAWVALFACLASMANVKTAELDVKQMVCTVTFSVMSLVVNYFGNPRAAAAAAPA